MNMLEIKKLKSWSPGITESWSFLVRYRRTYVLKNPGHASQYDGYEMKKVPAYIG